MRAALIFLAVAATVCLSLFTFAAPASSSSSSASWLEDDGGSSTPSLDKPGPSKRKWGNLGKEENEVDEEDTGKQTDWEQLVKDLQSIEVDRSMTGLDIYTRLEKVMRKYAARGGYLMLKVKKFLQNKNIKEETMNDFEKERKKANTRERNSKRRIRMLKMGFGTHSKNRNDWSQFENVKFSNFLYEKGFNFKEMSPQQFDKRWFELLEKNENGDYDTSQFAQRLKNHMKMNKVPPGWREEHRRTHANLLKSFNRQLRKAKSGLPRLRHRERTGRRSARSGSGSSSSSSSGNIARAASSALGEGQPVLVWGGKGLRSAPLSPTPSWGRKKQRSALYSPASKSLTTTQHKRQRYDSPAESNNVRARVPSRSKL